MNNLPAIDWITLAEADVLSGLADVEIEAYAKNHTAIDAECQGSMVGTILATVSAEIRGRVAACKYNSQMGPAGTIPPELRHVAISLARHRILSRLPLRGVMERRLTEYEEAVKTMEAVAACKFAVSPAANTTATSAPVGGSDVTVIREARTPSKANLEAMF